MLRTPTALWTIMLAGLMIGCSGGTQEAQEAVREFRSQASQQAFHAIYEASDPEFRAATSEENFAKLMSGLEKKLGRWESSDTPVWGVVFSTHGTLVTLTYQSKFANGPAREQFSWRVKNHRAALLRYDINSPVLLGI